MKVFLSGTSFHPAYGGPAYSVSRLAVALADEGIDVGLWSPDQSALTTTLVPAKSRVRRLGGNERAAIDELGGCDVLHDNGIWWPHNHRLAAIAAARGIPRLVSTRGMLERWAMHHKRVKKMIAWRLYQRRDLARARGHHATADAEAANVERLRLGVPIHVIPNGVDVPQAERQIDASRDRVALFLGRIYPVKGLPLLVEAWARVRPAGWTLRIAGPDESGHRREVERAISGAGLDDVIRFEGPLEHAAKQAALLSADLFVLPSLSESFGMAIGEALAHGVPVLTTTAVPWPSLVTHGCGWRVAPAVDALADGLRVATSLEADALRQMGRKGREMVQAEFGWSGIAARFVRAYRALAS